MHIYAALLAAVLPATLAWDAPQYAGFGRRWQSSFIGSSSTLPNGNDWNYITGDLGVNAELQIYTSSTRNMQLSGGETLQLVPVSLVARTPAVYVANLTNSGETLVLPEVGPLDVSKVDSTYSPTATVQSSHQLTGIFSAFLLLKLAALLVLRLPSASAATRPPTSRECGPPSGC